MPINAFDSKLNSLEQTLDEAAESQDQISETSEGERPYLTIDDYTE